MSEQRRKYYLGGSSVLRDDEPDQYFDSFPASRSRPLQPARMNTDLHEASYHSVNPGQRSVLPDLEPTPAHQESQHHPHPHHASRELSAPAPGKENVRTLRTREGRDLGQQLYVFLCREVRLKRGVASTHPDTLKEFWRDCVQKLAKKNAFKDNKKFAEYEKWGREDPADVYKTIDEHSKNKEDELKALRLKQKDQAAQALRLQHEKKDLQMLKVAVEHTYAHRMSLIQKEAEKDSKESPKKQKQRDSESPFDRAKADTIEEEKSAVEVVETHIFEETSVAAKKKEKGGAGGETRLRGNFPSEKDRNDFLNLEQMFFHSLLYHCYQADRKERDGLFPPKPREEGKKNPSAQEVQQQKRAEKQRMGDQILPNSADALYTYYQRHKLTPRLKWELPGGENGVRVLLEELMGREFALGRLQRLYEEGNRGVPQNRRISWLSFWEALELRKRALYLINPPNMHVWIQEKQRADAEAREADKAKTEAEKAAKAKELINTLKKKVLKKEPEKVRLEQLSKPKDKWLTGRTMKALQEQFPHDRVLERMIKEEFRENKVFRYPDEYDVYDEEEEDRRKKKAVKSESLYALRDMKEAKKEKVQRNLEKWMIDQQGRQRIKNRDQQEEMKLEKKLDTFISDKVKAYIALRKNRLNQRGPTQNQYLSQTYQEARAAHLKEMDKMFPMLTYGMSKKAAKRSFPVSFKRYFFHLFRSFYQDEDGTTRKLKQPPLTYWLPCSQVKSKNKKAEEMTAKKKKKDAPINSAWEKVETAQMRAKFLMTQDEVENCTFQPKLNKQVEIMGKKDEDEKPFHQRFGMNFKNAAPAIFKAGVLKLARQYYAAGRYKDARNKLREGFNIKSLYRNFDPQRLKKLEIKEAKEKAEQKRKHLEAGLKVENIKEEEDDQANMPAEDPNLPVVIEAWDLWMDLERDMVTKMKLSKELEQKRKKKEEEIKRAEERKSATGRSMKSTSAERREKKVYKSMMCPLKDRCPGDIRPRWPMSNTTAHTKMGAKCPYAHHQSELYFEQQDCLTAKGLKTKIDGIQKTMEQAEGGRAWVPPSLVTKIPQDQKIPSGLQKKIAAFNNSEKVRQKKEEKEAYDQDYTKKLGLLRKATVLYNFERFTEAFKVVAKAAIMVKATKDKEAQETEKKATMWKFRLGLPKTLDVIGELGELIKQRGVHFTERDLNAQGLDIPVQKAHILVEKCFDTEGLLKWDKSVYLNERIEEMYLWCEAALFEKQDLIKLMKKRVERLEEKGNLPSKPEGEEMTRKEKIERLVPVEKTVANMNKVIKAMQNSLKDLKPIKPWKPVKAGVVEDSAMMDMRSKRRPKEDEDEDSPRRAKKKISIYERDNLGELPFEIEDDGTL